MNALSPLNLDGFLSRYLLLARYRFADSSASGRLADD